VTLMLGLLLDVFAVHRLTRLITTDEITKPARNALIAIAYGDYLADPDTDWTEHYELDDDPPKLAYLIHCRWCASVWAAVIVLALHGHRGGRQIRNVLALSSASTLLVSIEP
jgi:hypothetical protein